MVDDSSALIGVIGYMVEVLLSPWWIKKLCMFLQKSLFSLLSLNEGASFPLMEDIFLPTFYLLLPLPHFIPQHWHFNACQTTASLSHPVFLSCRKSFLQRKFTQMRVYGL